MHNLPYLEPANEFSFNAAMLLLVLDHLAKTKRGKKVLNLQKLQIYLYLVSRPTVLNQVLRLESKPEVPLREDEYFSTAAISNNVDPLFHRQRIKALLQFVASKGLVQIDYKKDLGFLFELNEKGQILAQNLVGGFFDDVKRYTDHIVFLHPLTDVKLNAHLNHIFRMV